MSEENPAVLILPFSCIWQKIYITVCTHIFTKKKSSNGINAIQSNDYHAGH